MKCSFDESASADASSILRFYARQRRSLSVRFIDELYDSVALLAVHPYLGQRLSSTHRRIVLRSFPVSVIYQVDGAKELLQIVAVIDQRRKPRSWPTRVEEQSPPYRLAA